MSVCLFFWGGESSFHWLVSRKIQVSCFPWNHSHGYTHWVSMGENRGWYPKKLPSSLTMWSLTMKFWSACRTLNWINLSWELKFVRRRVVGTRVLYYLSRPSLRPIGWYSHLRGAWPWQHLFCNNEECHQHLSPLLFGLNEHLPSGRWWTRPMMVWNMSRFARICLGGWWGRISWKI